MRFLFLALALAASLAIRSNYLTSILIVIALQALPAIGLALLAGYTGQISLGHAAFYGLGAYGAALIAGHAMISPWFDAVLAAVLVGIIAWAIGWLVFRLKGHHLAMATLAFGLIVQIGFVELRGLTGGPNGLTGIAPLSVFDHPLSSDFAVFPIVWIACMAAIRMAENLIASPTGLAMRAVAENEKIAASLGTDVQSVKRTVMMLSGVLSAFGGALYAHWVGYLSPGPFDVGFSVKLLLMVAVGGFTNIWGVVFGVAVVTFLGEVLNPLGGYDVVAFGLLMVGSVIYFPRGLLDGLYRVARRIPSFPRAGWAHP